MLAITVLKRYSIIFYTKQQLFTTEIQKKKITEGYQLNTLLFYKYKRINKLRIMLNTKKMDTNLKIQLFQTSTKK